MNQAREQLRQIFQAAIAAVDPERLVREAVHAWPQDVPRRLIAAGKAGAAMARGYESALASHLVEGWVVTKDDHGLALDRCVLEEAGHPVPDFRSERAGRAARALAARTAPGEELVVLLSGGASALLTEPAPPLSLGDLAETTRVLLEVGADIKTLNVIRKHLTQVSGGRLAAAAARADALRVLLVSDVPGDDPATIASGPCAPDASTYEQACERAAESGAWPRLPEPVRDFLAEGRAGRRPESVEPAAPFWPKVHTQILATNADALAACEREAKRSGLPLVRRLPALTGEAREQGIELAAGAGRGEPGLRLAGGETTVTVRGSGRGGRSQELALAAALHWAVHRPVQTCHLLASGTDGTDGPTDAAGAFADAGTVARGVEAGVDAADAMARNDSYAFFAAEGGLFHTGPTHTNVMDLALLLVEPN